MAYMWTKDLETGNSMIDTQHKELIRAINDLLQACSAGKGRAEIEKTTKFLFDYTNKHFGDEERLQMQYGYPDMKRTVRDLTDHLNKEGPTVALVGKVNNSIAGWLINHIKVQDVKVAAHIRSKS